MAQLGLGVGCVLVEKRGGGPNSAVEEGQLNGFALGSKGPTKFSNGGSLKGVSAFGEKVFAKE